MTRTNPHLAANVTSGETDTSNKNSIGLAYLASRFTPTRTVRPFNIFWDVTYRFEVFITWAKSLSIDGNGD
jgi:hypothetical protein